MKIDLIEGETLSKKTMKTVKGGIGGYVSQSYGGGSYTRACGNDCHVPGHRNTNCRTNSTGICYCIYVGSSDTQTRLCSTRTTVDGIVWG